MIVKITITVNVSAGQIQGRLMKEWGADKFKQPTGRHESHEQPTGRHESQKHRSFSL
jgi:hypothetical protein